MWCCKCHEHISQCTCGDINERLAAVVGMGSFVYRKCVKCGEHYSRCKCQQPEWKIEGAPGPTPGEGDKN